MDGKLQGLESYLKARVIGQEDALSVSAEPFRLRSVTSTIEARGQRVRFCSWEAEESAKLKRPKRLRNTCWDGGLTMLYMNEYQRADDVDDLVLAIKRGAVCQFDRTTFLFDEIEKAHRGVIDVFISLLDEGQITDSDGSRISVGNCYLVLTSNIGAARWGSMETTQYARMESFAFEQARKVLRPELFNRLTETIVFRPLSQKVQIDILKEMLGRNLCIWSRG